MMIAEVELSASQSELFGEVRASRSSMTDLDVIFIHNYIRLDNLLDSIQILCRHIQELGKSFESRIEALSTRITNHT